KGFLFDLDGTLVDTAIDMLAALKTLASENGIDVEPDYHQYKELITYGSRAIVTSIFGQLADDVFKKLQHRYLEIYQNNLVIKSNLFAGIDTVIGSLDKADIPWGIVTNKPAYLAKPLIAALPQLGQCKVIIGGGCTSHAKPHPMPIIQALEIMQINPQSSWYIGDALTDIQAANAADMNSAVALWGYLKKQDKPEKWQSNSLLNNTLDILDL
ncbi:MAG: HAD hydrolase-like protein, partial [Alcanivoracaceae bacterium]|nr:HAD hydrolase-like protein [Alcanivoracaceae bacterium]